MNIKVIFKHCALALSVEAAIMALPLLLCFVYKTDDALCFIIPMVFMTALSLLGFRMKSDRNYYAKEGFAIVALSWILISFFGAWPYYLSGFFDSAADCFFESISGFTTTGATMLSNVEAISKPILFWRSLTLWFGGMGVLVFTMALLPMAGGQAFHIMRAESPGPSPGKLVPKMSETSKILYMIYAGMTVILILVLLACRMPVFDAVANGLSAAGTGGFSVLNNSIAGYNSPLIEYVLAIAVFLFGINFTLIFYFIKKDLAPIKADQEFKFYCIIVAVSALLIGLNLLYKGFYSPLTSFRHAFFQVSSIITTTGFSSANLDLWPAFSKAVMFILMFIGGSSGSTAGGIKCIRILLILKIISFEVSKIIHPRAVNTIKINGKKVNDQIVRGVMVFILTYLMIFLAALLIISLDGFDFETNVSIVALSIGNVGLGFGLAGPAGSLSDFSVLSKLTLSACMLFGRLEIFPLLLLLLPSFYKKVNI